MHAKSHRLLFTLILGLLLPAVTLRIGGLLLPEPTQPTQTEMTEPIYTWTTEAASEQTLPVLLPDGSLVQMDTDTYLTGVILAEMPTYFEMDALMAQAVVARTYAWKRHLAGDKHPEGAVCTDYACCQAYISQSDYLNGMGFPEDVQRAAQAASTTTGQVLTYAGKLAEAVYFSCSGGRTEDAAAVWGEQIPYLLSVESPGEEEAEKFCVTVTMSAEEFCQALGRRLTGDISSWLGSVTYTAGGGVATMTLAGQRYTGVELRSLLGLNSTAFTLQVQQQQIVITTKGHGHRVGMSQYGAEAMAVRGYNYFKILDHYYPGTAIDKLDTLE